LPINSDNSDLDLELEAAKLAQQLKIGLIILKELSGFEIQLFSFTIHSQYFDHSVRLLVNELGHGLPMAMITQLDIPLIKGLPQQTMLKFN